MNYWFKWQRSLPIVMRSSQKSNIGHFQFSIRVSIFEFSPSVSTLWTCILTILLKNFYRLIVEYSCYIKIPIKIVVTPFKLTKNMIELNSIGRSNMDHWLAEDYVLFPKVGQAVIPGYFSSNDNSEGKKSCETKLIRLVEDAFLIPGRKVHFEINLWTLAQGKMELQILGKNKTKWRPERRASRVKIWLK